MKKVIFWGTPEFAVPSLEKLTQLGLVNAVITQRDKPSGRGKKIQSSPIKIAAEKYNLPVLCPEKLDQAFLNELQKYLPATFAVVAYGKIIPKKILDISELPALNIHPSFLPELRGPSPIQTAIWQGLSQTGISLMVLDEKMDHGPILAQNRVKIEPLEAYFELYKRLSSLGGELLAQVLPDYLEGQIKPWPQDDSQATFCRLIQKSDGQINWSDTTAQIINQIRALNPWPGTTATINNLDIKILSALPASQKVDAGKIVIIDDKLLVGTADSAIQVVRCQPPGKKEMSAADFIRGYRNKLI